MISKKKGFSKKNKKSSPRKERPLRGSGNRGKVVDVVLKQPFTLNGYLITHAKIENDHINHGVNPGTDALKEKKRSDFTVMDIEKFLLMLDGEYLMYKKIRGRKLRYEFRIDSPLSGKTFGKTYLMVFETDFNAQHLIHTVTLFRVGN